MNCSKLAQLVYCTAVALVSLLLHVSHASTSIVEKEVTFLSGGQVVNHPLLSLLQVTMEEVNFDQMGFSVLELNVLLEYLSLQMHALHMIRFDEGDWLKYSLLLRFAHSLNSISLFELIAQDFYHLLGISVLDFIYIIPGMRSATFEPILFRVFLGLSSQLSLKERVEVFSFLINSVRPDFYSLEEFFSFDYKVLQVATVSQDWKITEWTVEIEGQLQPTFFIGKYDSEEWHLKFVDGNPHFELAKFLVTNAEEIVHSNVATLFSALARLHIISSEEREAALRIAVVYRFTDAMEVLKERESLSLNQPNSIDVEIPSILPSRKRKRTDGNTRPEQKKRRVASVSDGGSLSAFSHVESFYLQTSDQRRILVKNSNLRLFQHLQESLGSMSNPETNIQSDTLRVASSKTINMRDLSWESVKSFVELVKSGLSRVQNWPPNLPSYRLETRIPSNVIEQKELMSQVAQMVCVAIRLKFDEAEFFFLLDWYKESMNGVWEKLLEDGNEIVEEVCLARGESIPSKSHSNVSEIVVQNVQESYFQMQDEEINLNEESSLRNPTDSFSVKIFRIVFGNSTSFVSVHKGNGRLFSHLQAEYRNLKFQKGKLEFDSKKSGAIKRIKLPDLSWEAVKSYVEVVKRGLSNDGEPPRVSNYILAKGIPKIVDGQKELMSQVAQMVCVAIRLKFDEAKLFVLLEWYKVRMEGVWEQLHESGNECANEVDEARNALLEPLPVEVGLNDTSIDFEGNQYLIQEGDENLLFIPDQPRYDAGDANETYGAYETCDANDAYEPLPIQSNNLFPVADAPFLHDEYPIIQFDEPYSYHSTENFDHIESPHSITTLYNLDYPEFHELEFGDNYFSQFF